MTEKSINGIDTRQFLNHLRASSNYPTFRAFVSVMTLLVYALAALIIVLALSVGKMESLGLAVIGAICITLIGKIVAEVSLMVADIADSTIYTSANQIHPKLQSLENEFQSSQVTETKETNYTPPFMANEEENKLPITEKIKRWW